MSLSDRLVQAAAQRAGGPLGRLVAAEDAQAPGQAAPPTPAPAVTVVMDAITPVAAVEPDPGADPASLCPTCGRTGTVGVLDLHRRTADWSCLACGTFWCSVLPDGYAAPDQLEADLAGHDDKLARFGVGETTGR